MTRIILSLIFISFLSGCVATAKHVDKTEKMNLLIFDFLLKDKPEANSILREYEVHVSEGSGVQIDPKVITGLADGLIPGAGALITLALSLYAKKKHNETEYVTKIGVKAAKEKDPSKALDILSQDDKVRHFNG